MAEMSELWNDLGVHAAEEFPLWVSRKDLALRRRLVRGLGKWWQDLESMPRTLIHNDFNPRNVAFRQVDGAPRLCAYDWELATLHVPQHDLAELLCFVLTPSASAEEVDHYVEVHRTALERKSGREIDAEQWRYGFGLSVCDLAINRFALYLMSHTFRHYKFMERTIATLRRLLTLEGGH
jgi:aminoglycoside phosphotransferase (APT) family kinase protein